MFVKKQVSDFIEKIIDKMSELFQTISVRNDKESFVISRPFELKRSFPSAEFGLDSAYIVYVAQNFVSKGHTKEEVEY